MIWWWDQSNSMKGMRLRVADVVERIDASDESVAFAQALSDALDAFKRSGSGALGQDIALDHFADLEVAFGRVLTLDAAS